MTGMESVIMTFDSVVNVQTHAMGRGDGSKTIFESNASAGVPAASSVRSFFLALFSSFSKAFFSFLSRLRTAMNHDSLMQQHSREFQKPDENTNAACLFSRTRRTQKEKAMTKWTNKTVLIKPSNLKF